MALGPVEYIIVGFPGNQFNGAIIPEMEKLVTSGMVRILDLVFVTKDADGVVSSFEVDDLGEFGGLDGDIGGLIGPDDIEQAGAALEPNSSAGLLIWEDVWAAPFADAVRQSGGVVLEGARIPYELVHSALADLPPAV